MKIEISKITIKGIDKEIEITPSQARELSKQLNELFGIQSHSGPFWTAPIIINRDVSPTPWPYKWEVTCQSPSTTSGYATMMIGEA